MTSQNFDTWLIDRLTAAGANVDTSNLNAALEEYQADNDLPVTGLACSMTRVRLRQQKSRNPESPLIIFNAVPPIAGSRYVPSSEHAGGRA